MYIQKTLKDIKTGGLFLIATPIGNLDDITLRAIKTLEAVDYILAEDTRVTQKLLHHLAINKPLISFHEHNQYEKTAEIIEQIQAGAVFGLVSDAGMPCISDPGAILVTQMIANQLPLTVIPGVSASTALFSLSGMSEQGSFMFHGFLPTKEKAKSDVLAQYQTSQAPVIFYESPHRILKTLTTIAQQFAPETKICIGRELTKLHENLIWFTVAEFDATLFETITTWKGEIALILQPINTIKEVTETSELIALIRTRVEQGMKPKTAIKEVAKQTHQKTNELYKLWEQEK